MPIHTENFDGVTPPALPSGWSFGTGFVTTSSFLGGITPTSSPNALRLPATGVNTIRFATFGTQDSNSGDVTVTANFNADANSNRLEFGLTLRGNADPLVQTSSTFYWARVDVDNGGQCSINKVVAGTLTALGSSVTPSGGTPVPDWYTLRFQASSSTLTFTISRASDGFYLTSAGTWQAGFAVAITRTDSSITGSGYAGLTVQCRDDTAYVDDWDFSDAAGSVTATISVTDGDDSMAADGEFDTEATIAVADGDDIMVASGAIDTDAAMAATEDGDTFVGGGNQPQGSISLTEDADFAFMQGTFLGGSIAVTEDDDTMGAGALFSTEGAISLTEDADVFTAPVVYGNPPGYLLGEEGGDLANLDGETSTGSAIAVTESDDSMAGDVDMVFEATASITEDGDIFEGYDYFSAVLDVTEDGDDFTAFEGSTSTLLYNIYANTGIGDPIDYSAPIDTTALLTWTSDALAYPATWKFGVRAYSLVTALEEQNVDCAVTIILDAAGQDITNRPAPPTGLRAFPMAAGDVRVEWFYPLTHGAKTPTSFNVYKGTGGSPDYNTVAANVLYSSGFTNAFRATLTGLTNGVAYTIGVRAVNDTDEEPNTTTVDVTADSAGPSPVDSLTAVAIV